TNFRAAVTPPPGLRSRGLAVRELVLADDPDAYAAAIDPRAYAGMNLVWGDARGVSLLYSRLDGTHATERVTSGVHVLCNDRLGAPGFPRGERLRELIVRGVPLEQALGDHVHAATTPPSDLAPELARELTAICIHSPAYGTRSATIAAFEPGRTVA